MSFNKDKTTYQVLKWRITDDKLDEWKCLDSSFPREKANDCTINVITFFNLLNRSEAEEIAHLKNVEGNLPYVFKKGTYEYELINHFFTLSSNDLIRTKVYKFIDFSFDSNYIHSLEQTLTPGYGTLINMKCNHTKCVWHSIIAAVNSSGKLVMLDPQQLKSYTTYSSIENMIESNKYTDFSLPFKRASQVHKLADTILSVRKSHSSQRDKKRRRLQGGKSRKARKTKKTRK
jgi:hypothetical protein